MPATAVLIDDSRTTRALLKVYLTEAGFQVVGEGERGEHALELYEKHHPLLMTLDIVLPGIDGVTAVRALLEQHPEATVVMCSSINAREKVLACHEAGAAHYLLKPITPDKVQDVARKVLARLAAAQK